MRWASAALLLLFAGCARPSRSSPEAAREPDATAVSPASAAVDAGLAPLGGMPWLLPLRDGDDDLGVVSVPLGATAPRPIVIALHGAADRPEWACGEWRGVTNAYPILVCPRGQGPTSHLYWPAPAVTKRAIERALAQTRNALGPYIADVPAILVGFSNGATQTALLAREDPERFPRVVVAESSYDQRGVTAFASTYKGQRVLLSCTTPGCEPIYRNAAKTLSQRGIAVRVNQSGSGKHGIWDDVVRSLHRDWPWFVEGALGWEAWEAWKEPDGEDRPR